MAGLTLDIAANTRSAVSGVKDVGEALEKVADSLDDLARNAQRPENALERIGDAGKDAARDIDQAGDKVERTFRDMVQDAKKADRAVSDVGDSAKKGMGKASESVTEFKAEALSNFSEVTSSFDGSMSSIADLAQGTLGGIAGSLPGIGLAGGIAALGIGAITSALQEAADRSKEIKDGIVQDFLDLGSALDAEAVKARARDILGTDETRKQADMLADLLHITVGQAALAMAGDFDAAGVTAQQALDGINNASSNVDYDTLIKLRDTMTSTVDGFQLGQQAADDLADAMRRKKAADDDAAKSAKEAGDRVREFFDQARNPPPLEQTVRFRVDDSEVRAYRVPQKVGIATYKAAQTAWD
ncbi:MULTISPECIES: hypothetical protein [unclassified Microbacterium]|uniref:hypothetical protein n=1 Tax=unclassified Microbacterium TaxID=2609290 RepID=UPI0030170EC9